MWGDLLHYLNAKCLSEKRVGQRRLPSRHNNEGDLASGGTLKRVGLKGTRKNGMHLLRDLTAKKGFSFRI